MSLSALRMPPRGERQEFQKHSNRGVLDRERRLVTGQIATLVEEDRYANRTDAKGWAP